MNQCRAATVINSRQNPTDSKPLMNATGENGCSVQEHTPFATASCYPVVIPQCYAEPTIKTNFAFCFKQKDQSARIWPLLHDTKTMNSALISHLKLKENSQHGLWRRRCVAWMRQIKVHDSKEGWAGSQNQAAATNTSHMHIAWLPTKGILKKPLHACISCLHAPTGQSTPSGLQET